MNALSSTIAWKRFPDPATDASIMGNQIYTAPPNAGRAFRGRTLTSLLYDACARYPNPHLFMQPRGQTWEPLSLEGFREQAEETALGLQALGVARGDTVALFMESDAFFVVADMGCLLAGAVDVPIYLTNAPDAIRYVIEHAEAQTLFVSSNHHLHTIADLLAGTPVQRVVVAELDGGPLPRLPRGVELLSLGQLRKRGRAHRTPEAIEALKQSAQPDDLATIIYTSGTTGTPKGVMLSHENISFNALTAFDGLGDYRSGADGEVSLSFLPLTHVFARTLLYGNLAHGTTTYFATPDDLSRAFKAVRPTVFATVPRVLEKVYSRIREKAATLEGVKKRLLNWSLALAHQYEIGQEDEQPPLYKLQLFVADLLVFGQWRAAIGGRVRYVICGGAALSPELANLFAAAGVTVLQGYGLTETSPVIAYNRPHLNRAGTVGVPLPDVEVMIADDGEILTRGPHIMQGYYKDEEKTAEALAGGWFHTGDVGRFTDEGFLTITDRKKDLFKLSTGKYVMPQPLENRLTKEPLVHQAVVVGAGHKFTTALLFPEEDTLRIFARTRGLDAAMPLDALLQHPTVVARYQALVDAANDGMDPWCTIKRFRLVPAQLTIENGLLTPTLKVKRPAVREAFADEIEAMYADAEAA